MSESPISAIQKFCVLNVLFTSLVVFHPTWNGELGTLTGMGVNADLMW